MNHLQFQSTIGTIGITWSSQGLLTRIDWYPSTRTVSPQPGFFFEYHQNVPPSIATVISQMQKYFQSGEPFGRVPWEMIDTRCLSDFQIAVYRAASEIPHGETRTYAWIAKRVNKMLATRAVGQALKKNPMPILIPCHRVVAEKSLGGFMGVVDPTEPEIQLKQKLMELEHSYINPIFPFINAGIKVSIGATAATIVSVTA